MSETGKNTKSYASLADEARHKAAYWAAFDVPVLASCLGRCAAELTRLRQSEAALREACQELLDAGWEQNTLSGGHRRMAADANARHAIALASQSA